MEYPVKLVPENIEIYENFINKTTNIYKCKLWYCYKKYGIM